MEDLKTSLLKQHAIHIYGSDLDKHTNVYAYLHACTYIYIYIYIEREREREILLSLVLKDLSSGD